MQIENSSLIIEINKPLRGVWTFEFWEGDKAFNYDCTTPLNRLLSRHTIENLITTVGKGLVLDRIFGLSAVIALAGTAVGTSATAAAIGDTAITGAAYKAFAATPTRTALAVTALTSYTTAEANINIQEAGLLTASGGSLFNRLAPIGPFNKTSAVALDVTTVISQT